MICPFCSSEVVLVRVHGHSQCPVCKSNVEPCCDGEIELKWHPVNSEIPAGWKLAQSLDRPMHHNHYQVLIERE